MTICECQQNSSFWPIELTLFIEKEGRFKDDNYPKFMKIECSNYYNLYLVNLERWHLCRAYNNGMI